MDSIAPGSGYPVADLGRAEVQSLAGQRLERLSVPFRYASDGPAVYVFIDNSMAKTAGRHDYHPLVTNG